MIDKNRIPINDAGRFAWLRLTRSANVGPVTFASLMNRYESASAALDAIPELAKKGGAKRVRLAETALIEKELEAAAAIGAQMLMLGASGLIVSKESDLGFPFRARCASLLGCAMASLLQYLRASASDCRRLFPIRRARRNMSGGLVLFF